jgi:histidinol phosphatase-like PHP family hydrolase
MPNPVFKEYSKIDADYVLSDMHMHSTWTDGQGSIEENISQAKILGLKRISATDHIRSDSTYFDDYAKEIRSLREKLNFEIYIGFEAKVNNFQGHLDVSDKDLKNSEVSICSVHRFPIGTKLIPAKAFNESTAQEIELELSLAAINKGGFSVMGHPGGMSIRAHNIFKKEYFEEIIIACKKNNIAFDFNASYHQECKNELKELFKIHDPLISIGSDAHRIEFIGNANRTLFND